MPEEKTLPAPAKLPPAARRKLGVGAEMRALFSKHPKRKYTRADLMKRFAAHSGAANSTVHTLYREGFIARVDAGVYQRAGKGVRSIPVSRAYSRPKSNGMEYFKGKARGNGHDVEASKDQRSAMHNRKDAIVYLNHARHAIKHKDSREYMLVSLALFTLQGKM